MATTPPNNSTERPHSKADLDREINTAWINLNAALERLTPEQMTEIRDAEGWAVKDHLVHIAAWERSVVAWLQGQPRHVGLGVEEHIYTEGDDDVINAAIQQQHKQLSPAEAQAEMRTVHDQLLRLLEPLDDDDLYRASSDVQPESSGERDERPLIGMIYSNTAGHFEEHQGWIESLVAQR